MLVGTVGTRRDADVSAAALPRLLIAFAAAVGFELATRSKQRGAPIGVLLDTQKELHDAGLRALSLNLSFLLVTQGKAGGGTLALGPQEALSRSGCAPVEAALLRTTVGEQTGLTELLAFAGILSAASGRAVSLAAAASCLLVKSSAGTNRGLASVCAEALERITGLTPEELREKCFTSLLTPPVVAVHRLAMLHAEAAHAASVLQFHKKAQRRQPPTATVDKLKAASLRAAKTAKAVAVEERAAAAGPHAAYVAASSTLSGNEVEAALRAHAPKAWLPLREPLPAPSEGKSRGRDAVGATASTKRRRCTSAAAKRAGGRDVTLVVDDVAPRPSGLLSRGGAALPAPATFDPPYSMELGAAATPQPMLHAGDGEISASAGISLPPGFEAESLLLDDDDIGASAWPATWPATSDAALAAVVLALLGGGADAQAAESVERSNSGSGTINIVQLSSTLFSAGLVAPETRPPPPAGDAEPRTTRATAAARRRS